jgi:hypothetical protein
MVYPRIYHVTVYTMYMWEVYTYVVYTRHIPGIYRKLGFQMNVVGKILVNYPVVAVDAV